MENKQLIKYKESIISKIKRFFFNLFKGKKETYVQETSDEIDADVKKQILMKKKISFLMTLRWIFAMLMNLWLKRNF